MRINNDMIIGRILQRVLDARSEGIFEITHGVDFNSDVDYIIGVLNTFNEIIHIQKEELPYGWKLRIRIQISEV